MTVKVKLKFGDVIIETDDPRDANAHYLIRDYCRDVIGAMRDNNIKELEIERFGFWELKRKFNEEYKKKGYPDRYFRQVF